LLLALAELVQVHARLEVVCARDVGHCHAFVLTFVVETLVERAPRAGPEVDPRIGHRDGIAPHTRYPSLLAVIPALREVCFDQEPTGQRVRVVGRPQELRNVTVLGYSFWREDRTHLFQERKRTLARGMFGETRHELLL